MPAPPFLQDPWGHTRSPPRYVRVGEVTKIFHNPQAGGGGSVSLLFLSTSDLLFAPRPLKPHPLYQLPLLPCPTSPTSKILLRWGVWDVISARPVLSRSTPHAPLYFSEISYRVILSVSGLSKRHLTNQGLGRERIRLIYIY